jgi:hypothetical protein
MNMQKDFRERVEYFNAIGGIIDVTVSLEVTFDSDAAVYAIVGGHKSRKAMRVRIGDNLNISFVVPPSTRYSFHVEYGGLKVRGARVQRRASYAAQDDNLFQPTYPAIDETPYSTDYTPVQPQPFVEPELFTPQGGTFGGAGASGSWDAPEPARESYTSSYSSRDDSSYSSSSSSSSDSSSSSSSDSGGGGGGD